MKDDFAGPARPAQDAFGAFDAGSETADLDEDAGELRAHGIKRGVVALLGSQYFLALVHEIAARCGGAPATGLSQLVVILGESWEAMKSA